MNSSLFTPDYSHLTGLLQHLNDDELKELLNSDAKLKEIVHDLKQIHDIEAEREMLITSNKSISEYNLSKKPILEEHRKQVEETRKIALELKDSLLEKKRKIDSKQGTSNNEELLALLQAATSEKEGEAEASVEMFLHNELSVEEFVPKYLELKKIAHLRRIKAEKLSNILLENGSRNVMPPTRPQRPKKPVTAPSGQPVPFSYTNPMVPNNTPLPARQAPQPPSFMPPYHPGAYMPPNPVRPVQGVPNYPYPHPQVHPQGYPPYSNPNPYIPRFPTYK